MGHVVLVTSEMAGRINMTCELARRLAAAGHTAAVASPVDIRDRVEAQGVRYVDVVPTPTDPPPSQKVTVAPHGPLERIRGFVGRLGQIRTIDARRTGKVEAMGLGRFIAALERESADLVLIDVELPAQVMAASGAKMPVALWTSMLSLWKRPGVPPLGSPIVPGRGWHGSRIGIELAWLRFRSGKWLRRQRHRITRLGEDQVSVLEAVAQRTDFPFAEEADMNQWLIPFTYRTLPTVSFNARELEFPHDPHPAAAYVGPVLPAGQKRAHPGVDEAETRQRLEKLFARRRNGDSTALIYASFGAWHKGDDRSFLRRVLDAVAQHPEWDVVVGLGGRLDAAALGAMPENVQVFAWAPQLEILAEADCAIHHGGISTVNECITHSVPMVLYPFEFMDQPGNAARIAYHGIGEVGDRTTDSAARIGASIERQLSDPSVRTAMRRMSNALATYQRDHTAVRYVETLLDGGGT